VRIREAMLVRPRNQGSRRVKMVAEFKLAGPAVDHSDEAMCRVSPA
jgi:hypothetical protein